MMAGVTIMAPELDIAPEVQIGENTLIYPGTYLERNDPDRGEIA